MSDGDARLRLLTRVDCHLCEEAARELARLGIAFATIDVDLDKELTRLYGDSIPVLLDGDIEVARAPLTAASLEMALSRLG